MNKKVILAIASMGIFVEALDIAIVNLALPVIEKDLGLTNESSYKLQSGYVLIYGCFLILGGKLSDYLGRKNIFLAGSIIFLLTSLGAGLSSTFEALLTFRLLQGLGAALLMPSAFSIVNYYFTDSYERSKAIAIFGSFAATGSAAGLSVGGIIASYWGWSWIFLINIPVLLVIIFIAYIHLEKDTKATTGKPDIPSAIALVVSMLSLTWVTELLAKTPDKWLDILLSFTAFILSGYYLYRRLRKQPVPLINLQLFALSSLRKGNLLFLLLGALFSGYLFLMSFLVQHNFNFSAAKAGFLMMPFNILSILIGRFGIPVLSLKLSPKKIASLGALAMLTGAFSLVMAVQYNHLFFLLTGGALIAGVGMTLCFTAYSVIAMEKVPVEHLGVGGSLTNTAYFLGGGIGLPLLSAFMSQDTGKLNSIPLMILMIFALCSILVLLMRPNNKIKQSIEAAIQVQKRKDLN
ncbi:MFS transporter [Gynurincola endophyticus]|uniref:MFS transporter n=1 Tax=Gynurincola endophyticus TaxID=2479004 RepID=UPI000F8C5ABC|nr:MFS transporter [Gynurincola endophyticus]